MQEYGEWGGSVILVRHNLSTIPLTEHNFEHNTLVSRVTPESIILYFSSIIRQNLNLGKNNRRRKKSRQGKQKKKKTVLASAVRCRMIGKQVLTLLAEALISGLLPGGGTWRKKTIFTQHISLNEHRAHYTECSGTIGQIATPDPI